MKHGRRGIEAVGLLAALVGLGGCGGGQGGPTQPPAIQLALDTVLGRRVFPIGNTARGGRGQAISGLSCDSGEHGEFHHHSHLSLFVRGEQIAIPAGIGIVDPQEVNGRVDEGSCLYSLHTHAASGILHVESLAPARFTLGQFFDIWGQPLTTNNVAGFQGTLSVYIDGRPYHGDARAISLEAHREITLEVGTPLVPPPTYIFPPGL